MMLAAVWMILLLVPLLLALMITWSEAGWASLARTFLRLLVCKGRRARGELTGIRFPIRVTDLTGENGPSLLTSMLRDGGHLPMDVAVKSIWNRNSDIRDGVKGDKAILELHYDGPTDLPKQVFVKFNLRSFSPMRLLVETTEVCRCEALFYYHLAAKVANIATPKCYFVDYSATTGEFVLLSDVVRFGEDGVLALKHRIRDAPSVEEQRFFISSGASLNAAFPGSSPDVVSLLRFDRTHRGMWFMAQMIAWFGLRHTLQRTLKGKLVNQAFMTWDPPGELLGKEHEIIQDMPDIMTSLCENDSMLAFGHNDLTTDNAYFYKSAQGVLNFGAFDWQQSCLNNVGQEWAWNLHFLPPEFLDKHEQEFIDLILDTYAKEGMHVSREEFLDAYVLGTVQMFVWGGGGLQPLLSDLHKRGIFETMVPNDPRCRSGEGLDADTLEKVVGAEMTRRTFTNCCRIMRRHNFLDVWRRWREQRKHGGQTCKTGKSE